MVHGYKLLHNAVHTVNKLSSVISLSSCEVFNKEREMRFKKFVALNPPNLIGLSA